MLYPGANDDKYNYLAYIFDSVHNTKYTVCSRELESAKTWSPCYGYFSYITRSLFSQETFTKALIPRALNNYSNENISEVLFVLHYPRFP